MDDKNLKKLKKVKFNSESSFVRNEKDFLFTEVDGEAVLMNTLNGTYLGLNETANFIWNQLPKSASINELIKAILEEYEVEESICKDETQRVLAQMLNSGIITLNQ